MVAYTVEAPRNADYSIDSRLGAESAAVTAPAGCCHRGLLVAVALAVLFHPQKPERCLRAAQGQPEMHCS